MSASAATSSPCRRAPPLKSARRSRTPCAACSATATPRAGHPVKGTKGAQRRGPVITGDGVGEHLRRLSTPSSIPPAPICPTTGTSSISGATPHPGDLKHGRTVHSLAQLVARLERPPKLQLVSPAALAMPAEVTDAAVARGVTCAQSESLAGSLPAADVLYVTRIQKERFSDPAEYERLAGSYVVDAKLMGGTKKDMIVLHPLPRVDEIATDFDDDPRAVYSSRWRMACTYGWPCSPSSSARISAPGRWRVNGAEQCRRTRSHRPARVDAAGGGARKMRSADQAGCSRPTREARAGLRALGRAEVAAHGCPAW